MFIKLKLLDKTDAEAKIAAGVDTIEKNFKASGLEETQENVMKFIGEEMPKIYASIKFTEITINKDNIAKTLPLPTDIFENVRLPGCVVIEKDGTRHVVLNPIEEVNKLLVG